MGHDQDWQQYFLSKEKNVSIVANNIEKSFALLQRLEGDRQGKRHLVVACLSWGPKYEIEACDWSSLRFLLETNGCKSFEGPRSTCALR